MNHQTNKEEKEKKEYTKRKITKRAKRKDRRFLKQTLFLTSPILSMSRIVQWNHKGLRARHKKVWFLMNIFQLSCICLQEVMLENLSIIQERKYDFQAIIPLEQRSKGGTAVAIKKEIAHKRLNIRTTLQVVTLEVQLVGENKITICSIYLPPTDQVTEEDMTDLLEQFPTPMILLGDFNTYNPLWRNKKTNTRGRILEKILDTYNHLCLNGKEETQYKIFNSCKSTIDL